MMMMMMTTTTMMMQCNYSEIFEKYILCECLAIIYRNIRDMPSGAGQFIDTLNFKLPHYVDPYITNKMHKPHNCLRFSIPFSLFQLQNLWEVFNLLILFLHFKIHIFRCH